MFEDAIEKVSASMRPVHTLMRKYKDQTIIPSSATLLFINDEGCAITTRSFADMLIASSQMEKKYARFREEKNALKRDWHYEGKLKTWKPPTAISRKPPCRSAAFLSTA